MYEYRVETSKVLDAQRLMNQYAKEGWRVIEVSPNIGMGYGMIITFEREKND